MADKSKILVDGNCIVCDFEISHYKRIAPSEFEIVDIADPGFSANDYGLNAEAVNKHLHVLTPAGDVLKGVEAFRHIWSRIPRYKWAEKLIGTPGIRGIAEVGYAGFAAIRPLLPRKK